MLDLVLAIAHHIAIFALFGVLIAELVLIHRAMSPELVQRLGKIDNWYGILAGIIVVVGFSRAIFAAKGWEYYQHNGFFWAKIATFVLIALLSVPPTIRFIQWRLQGVVPDAAALRGVRNLLYAEVALFPLLLIFAAAMARGYGEF
jgi:putative membrane protein